MRYMYASLPGYVMIKVVDVLHVTKLKDEEHRTLPVLSAATIAAGS